LHAKSTELYKLNSVLSETTIYLKQLVHFQNIAKS